MPTHRLQVFIAEFIATFALCFVGILAIHAAGDSLVTVALAHGLIITVMVAAVGAVSGAHINPAVTFGFVVTGRMNVLTAAIYWLAQLVGATVAGLLLAAIFNTDAVVTGMPQLANGVDTGRAILLEVVTTFFLVFVIFGSAVDERAPKSVFPFAIGLTVALDMMAIGPLTGAAMNPARYLGPAIATGTFSNVAVYLVGPLVGGALGALVQHFVLMNNSPSPAVAEHGGPAPSEERH